MGGGGSGPLTPLDPPLSSLLMKLEAKIDKIYLSVFWGNENSQMKNEPHLIFPTFNDQIHIVLQYIDIFQRMFYINKLWDFVWEINLLIKNLTSENDDNSRLEKLRFQSAGRAKMCTFVAIGAGGGGGVSITRFSPIYFSAIISSR